MTVMAQRSKLNLFERFTPILLISTIILAFFVGVLWQKVSDLEKGPSGGGVANPSEATATDKTPDVLSVDALKKTAGTLGLDQGKFDSCLDESKYQDKVSKEAASAAGVGINGTPGFLLNGLVISGAQPYSVFKDTIDYELEGGSWTSPSAKVKYLVDGNFNNGEISIDRQSLDIGDSPVKGDAGAKITFIEFSDFQCPFCSSFYANTLSQITKEYIDTGKLKLVYKQLPLTFHQYAQKAAEASLCANEQGKFWEFHDAVFNGMASI
jgi:protein-disulfide isomerase